MIRVRLVKDWEYPELTRQTPGNDGVWGDILATDAPVDECDYLLLMGPPSKDVVVRCPPENVWMICQEPPTEGFRPMHGGVASCSRVFMQDMRRKPTSRLVYSQPALPWHVNRDYQFLVSCSPPAKQKPLSWITSNQGLLRGHRARMDFLRRLQKGASFDLFGRGFNEIEDKWNGLAPYRYTLAIENFRCPYYFTEKVMDALLAWTMPIYCGCTNLADFLPKESFVVVDITAADAVEQVQRIVESDMAERNIEAIAEARRRILNRYHLYPFLAAEIAADQVRRGNRQSDAKVIRIPGTRLLLRRAVNRVSRLFRP